MSLRKSLSVVTVLASLALLAACGSGSAHITPPPGGSFSNSNLNGTYVFSASGTNVDGFFFASVGSFTANGSGAISTGALDLNDAEQGVFLDSITSGTYNVTADGRGTATLSTPDGAFGIAFVLTSTSHGLVTRFDNGGSGSGSLDLQGSVSQAQLATSYAMNLSGVDTTFTNPLATVGGFTLDSSGAMNASGEQDVNDAGTGLAQLALDGSVLAGSAGLPGTASLITSTTLGTLSFDVFPIDANHFKMIETDSVAILAGDAFSQSTFPSGNTVFSMSGFDASNGVPFVAGGFMNTDGNGNISSTSSEDINDLGVAPTVTFSGLYSTPLDASGRSDVSLIGFDNASLSGTTEFAAYPSTGGLQMLEVDGLGITGGFALAQSSTALTSGQGYGLNLTGFNVGGGFEEDDIAEFTNTNGSFAGVVDFNDQGSISPRNTFSATYTPDSSNTGRATIASGSFNLLSYVVSNSNVLFIETDTNQVGLGSFQSQTVPTQAAAANHLASIRAGIHPHGAIKRKHAAAGTRVRVK